MVEVYSTIERLDNKFSFFSELLSTLNVVESHNISSAGTNGRSLVVNPVFF